MITNLGLVGLGALGLIAFSATGYIIGRFIARKFKRVRVAKLALLAAALTALIVVGSASVVGSPTCPSQSDCDNGYALGFTPITLILMAPYTIGIVLGSRSIISKQKR